MSIKKPENENYAGVVAEIKTLIPLENCDNVQHTNIMGNLVVIGKTSQIGNIGVFFPVETQLANEFLSNNNLFRHADLNIDKTKKGYFEDNGRIKCVKFRGHKSQGIFLPLDSLSYTKHNEPLQLGDTFDQLNGIPVCKKYVIIQRNIGGLGSKVGKQWKKISKLVENQFHFHIDTSNLGKNIWKIKPDDLIHTSSKWHGTSLISSRILCNRKLNIVEKLLMKLGVKINPYEYDNIYSSRKVVKNDAMNKTNLHFYKEDIWGLANDRLKDFLADGMTIYAEIVGYLTTGAMIQKDYDYGCEQGQFDVVVYRITYTNISGKIFEFSAKQVQDWCRENGLKSVKQLYYGKAKDLFNIPYEDTEEGIKKWQDAFLSKLTEEYLDKDCPYCKNKVPAEGIVLRKETNDIDVYKWKSFRFLERESKLLDKRETNVEDEQSTEATE